MIYLLIALFIYLTLGVYYWAQKRPDYSHTKDTISELGENGSKYEQAVGFTLFMPVGLGFLLLAGLAYYSHMPAAVLAAAMGFSYFMSAFFPCDSGTPVSGTWKNTLHNLVGGIAYVTMVYQLRELLEQQFSWLVQMAFIALAVFLINFILGWPKPTIGLTQRLAETSVFVVIFMLLLDGAINLSI